MAPKLLRVILYLALLTNIIKVLNLISFLKTSAPAFLKPLLSKALVIE